MRLFDSILALIVKNRKQNKNASVAVNPFSDLKVELKKIVTCAKVIFEDISRKFVY